jgi:putative phosphoesterase
MKPARKSIREDAPAPVRRSLELGAEGGTLVVVADTHSRPHEGTMPLIAREKPDAIVHAGDIGDLRVLDELAALAPVLAVRGNIDAPVREVPEALTIELLSAERALIKLLVVHIGVNGPRLRADAVRLAERESAALVICGHSHVPFIGRDRGLGIFNPGSAGPRRFGLPIVFGVLRASRAGGLRMHHVDCETGKIWTP